jgi:hypothetical protein
MPGGRGLLASGLPGKPAPARPRSRIEPQIGARGDLHDEIADPGSPDLKASKPTSLPPDIGLKNARLSAPRFATRLPARRVAGSALASLQGGWKPAVRVRSASNRPGEHDLMSSYFVCRKT